MMNENNDMKSSVAQRDNFDSDTMKQPDVTFVLTGFGKFGNITHNPTTAIVQHFLDSLVNQEQRHAEFENLDNTCHVNIQLCKIINTAASSVNSDIDEIMNNIELEEILNSHNKHIVLIHLGVDYKADTFKLESTAYNEASFRIPDEDGYQPKKKPIDDRFPIKEKLQTNLNVRKICNDMIKREFDVKVSGDCGRFVCNYLYFSSLNKIREKIRHIEYEDSKSDQVLIHAMFVHVPLFTVIDKDTQLKFVNNLLDCIQKDISSQKKRSKKMIKDRL